MKNAAESLLREAIKIIHCHSRNLPGPSDWLTRARALIKAIEKRKPVSLPQARNEWKEAVIDELIVCFALTTEHEEDPKKAIKDAIAVNVRWALDPAISSEAQALMDSGMSIEQQLVVERLRKEHEVIRDALQKIAMGQSQDPTSTADEALRAAAIAERALKRAQVESLTE